MIVVWLNQETVHDFFCILYINLVGNLFIFSSELFSKSREPVQPGVDLLYALQRAVKCPLSLVPIIADMFELILHLN